MAVCVVPSPPGWAKEPLSVPLAPHSASGFKGVLKVRDGCFQARVNIKGKGRCTVWTAPTAEEAAWVLQKWRNNPCGLSSPGKKCAHKREMECACARLTSRFCPLTTDLCRSQARRGGRRHGSHDSTRNAAGRGAESEAVC